MLGAFAHFFVEGGSFMFVILFVAFVAFVIEIVQIVMLRKLNLIPAIVCAFVLLLLVGGFGFASGLHEGLAAYAMAPPDMKAPMVASSLSMSLNTATFSLMLAVPLLIAGTIVVVIRQNRS